MSELPEGWQQKPIKQPKKRQWSSLKRTPITRKHPLANKPRKPLKRTPLKKVSKSQREKMKKYYEVRDQFLKENRTCHICIVLEHLPANRATEVHHIHGRGPNLCDPRGFCASCRLHRDWPHENPKEARELGLLGEPWEWLVPIDQHKNPEVRGASNLK